MRVPVARLRVCAVRVCGARSVRALRLFLRAGPKPGAARVDSEALMTEHDDAK